MPVKPGERLLEGKVAETCRAAGQGLEAVCSGPRNCQFTDTNYCILTPLSTICIQPMLVITEGRCRKKRNEKFIDVNLATKCRHFSFLTPSLIQSKNLSENM